MDRFAVLKRWRNAAATGAHLRANLGAGLERAVEDDVPRARSPIAELLDEKSVVPHPRAGG